MGATVFAAGLLVFVVQLRPDYLHPTELGTDVATYLAAGQRVIDGHRIYELMPGDRPLHIWPPYWTAALVGPPTIAVLWAPIAAWLPPVVSMFAWWIAVLVSTAVVYLRTILKGPPLVILAAGLLSMSVVITGLSGNVNGLLIAGLSAVWFLARDRASTRANVAIGIIIAIAGAIKLSPLYFGLWLLSQRRWIAALACAAAGCVILLLTLIVAGLDSIRAYFDLAASTASGGVTPLSIGGILQSIGLPHAVVVAAPLGTAAVTALLAFLTRRRPALAFSIVAIGSTFAVPVVRIESLSMLLVALIPWTGPAGRASPAQSASSGSTS